MNVSLSEKIYAFLQAYLDEHGYPPTVREVGAHCRLSHSAVIGYLDWMEGRGQIVRKRGLARSITLVSETPTRR